jgi:hypothetical protein
VGFVIIFPLWGHTLAYGKPLLDFFLRRETVLKKNSPYQVFLLNIYTNIMALKNTTVETVIHKNI